MAKKGDGGGRTRRLCLFSLPPCRCHRGEILCNVRASRKRTTSLAPFARLNCSHAHNSSACLSLFSSAPLPFPFHPPTHYAIIKPIIRERRFPSCSSPCASSGAFIAKAFAASPKPSGSASRSIVSAPSSRWKPPCVKRRKTATKPSSAAMKRPFQHPSPRPCACLSLFRLIIRRRSCCARWRIRCCISRVARGKPVSMTAQVPARTRVNCCKR